MVLREDVAEPMAWKAALEGAKMVTSLRESTAETRFVCVKAPAKAVSWESIAEPEAERGIVKTVSMMWITPPVNMTSYFMSAPSLQTQSQKKRERWETYCSSDGTHLLQPTHQLNLLPTQHPHHDLPPCNVRKRSIRQQTRHKLCCSSEST